MAINYWERIFDYIENMMKAVILSKEKIYTGMYTPNFTYNYIQFDVIIFHM